MALDLKLSICNSSNCSTVSITDTTGTYDASDNTGGYGAPNPLTGDTTSAIIVITYQDGSVTTTDVTSQHPNPQTTETFTFTDIALPSTLDGSYTVKYTVINPTGTYVVNSCMILTCNARCCIDKMWAKAAEEASYDCGCDSYMKKALQAEGMLKALKNSAILSNDVARDKLLDTIQRLCKMEDCNCK